MSWDAALYPDPLSDDHGWAQDWNYTHNCNRMISLALEAVEGEPAPPCGGPLGKAIGPAWWDRLNKVTGADGADYLDTILIGLRADPDRFRPMNPENGWGSYDSLVMVLAEMAAAGRTHPTGIWRTSG